MTFILGMALGSLLTIGASFIAAGSNILDENDENYYN
jgi:hypothetical protein